MLSANEKDKEGWISNDSAAFLSLKTALHAYFETYRVSFEEFQNPIKISELAKLEKFDSNLYKSLYFTTITQFQIFFELILKDSVRRIDRLFAVKQSIGFRDALKRLKNIQEADPEEDVIKKIDFLLSKEEVLKKLNGLRNRIWHRGLYYLFYPKLDCFICGKILPLVKQVTDLDWYSENKEWIYKNLKCGVDPIASLINEIDNPPVNYEKIALLKEMGRAAYHNPIIYLDNNCPPLERGLKVNCNREKMKYVNVKVAAVRNELLSGVYICPVCGQKTFLKYELNDPSYDGNECYSHYIPEKLKCETCSFEIRSNIEDLSLCGINCKNFWKDHD